MSVNPQPDPQPEPVSDPVEPTTEPTEPTPGTETETPEEEEAAEEGEPSATPPDGEPPPEETAPQGLTQAEWEDRFKKAERAFSTYTKRVSDIWEEDATLLVPLTFSPSAPPGFLSGADVGRIPDEAKKPLLKFLGITQEIDYKPDPRFPMCEMCAGEGEVATGSHVPKYRKRQCLDCGGHGYIDTTRGTANGPTSLQAVPVPVGAPEDFDAQPDTDRWGIEKVMEDGRLNPNWGRSPEYWDHDFPIGRV
jgi:hypothetical protein